jgi:dGTPase
MAKNTNLATEEQYSEGEGRFLAPYACFSENSRGRLHDETSSEGRSEYQRDRDRIIHSAAFRRLEYKTQVFVNHEGDHYRTRLTHSLEVAQLARSAARELRINEDLSEALALSHDLGHPPFGHAGEYALQAVMDRFGGFDHNAQALRILTKLEAIYADFDGLNLTWETLEGIAKHNGPIVKKKGQAPDYRVLKEITAEYDLDLHTHSSVEAQVTALCDDIAYNNHDIEDGLRAKLFEVKDILEVPLVGEVFKEVGDLYPDLEYSRLIHEAKRRLINVMSKDLVQTSLLNIQQSGVKNVDDVRGLGEPVAAFSENMQQKMTELKEFLMERMYRHYKVNRMTIKAQKLVKDVFDALLEEPSCLPTTWQKLTDGRGGSQVTAVVVADYIAGMTDRFAYEEYKRLFDVSYKIIGSDS